MSGTSKAVLSICVLLLAGLVVYYGMAPVDQRALSIGDIPARNANNVRLFGRDLDAATAALGIPSPIVEITEERVPLETLPSNPVIVESLPPVVEEPATVKEQVYYNVVSGDTLGEIAHKLLGSAKYASRIAALNNINDPRSLQLGRTLRIPDIAATKVNPLAVQSEIPANTTIHVIQDGETLSDIAEDYLGSPHRWRAIWDANKSSISNPDRLVVGKSIVIP
jgi:nucleoid-associated protein YgaU